MQRKATSLQENNTHSVNANLYPMHDRFPLIGFPLRKVRTFAQRPGMAFVAEGRLSQRSGLVLLINNPVGKRWWEKRKRLDREREVDVLVGCTDKNEQRLVTSTR